MRYASEGRFAQYREELFRFEGFEAAVVVPPCKPNGGLALKTVYYGAFPQLEYHLLELGYHVACIDCEGRWGREDEIDRMARFVQSVSGRYGLNGKCIPIGMSAGGACAIKLGALHPEAVSVLYLDNPVVDYFSCPLGFGVKSKLVRTEEFLNYYHYTVSSVLTCRTSPFDYLPKLAAARVPMVLAYGTADEIVPFEENEKYLIDLYDREAIPSLIIPREGMEHHPHGVEDDSGIIDFFRTYDSAVYEKTSINDQINII